MDINTGRIVPADTKVTKPVLIHVNPQDWQEFRRLVGSRRASYRLRVFIRSYNAKMRTTQR